MKTKAKARDCVEMKNQIQAERLAEYRVNEKEYSSFAEFVRARASKSKWIKEIRENLASRQGG